jgi:hypothetical protein
MTSRSISLSVCGLAAIPEQPKDHEHSLMRQQFRKEQVCVDGIHQRHLLRCDGAFFRRAVPTGVGGGWDGMPDAVGRRKQQPVEAGRQSNGVPECRCSRACNTQQAWRAPRSYLEPKRLPTKERRQQDRDVPIEADNVNVLWDGVAKIPPLPYCATLGCTRSSR